MSAILSASLFIALRRLRLMCPLDLERERLEQNQMLFKAFGLVGRCIHYRESLVPPGLLENVQQV